MKKIISANQFLILFLILLASLLQSCATFKPQISTKINPIDTLLASKFFNSTQAGISIYDLTDNKPLYSHNEDLLLHPASNQKILTTSAAYLFLGQDYKFETSVYYTGEINDSICSGDLYFVGGFDPDFTLNDLDTLVSNLKTNGIKGIRGNLYADVSAMDSLFWGAGWMWDDDPYSFMPYLTPLEINKDNVTVITSPGKIGERAEVKIIPSTSYFDIINTSATVDSGNTKLKVTRDWLNRKNTIIVKGTLEQSALPDTTVLNVVQPSLYFLQLIKERCINTGIKIDGKMDTLSTPANAIKLYSYFHPLEEVINHTNKNSDNLNAEMLLRVVANKYYGKHASAKEGLILVDSLITLSGFNPKNYRLVDGSGLSHYNLVSAELINGVLRYLYFKLPQIFKLVFNSFPISGYDGTLIHRMNNSLGAKKVHAKTGTLSGISSLSGYLENKENHILSFSILIQNYVGSAKQAESIEDQLCEIFYQGINGAK